jgi:hypothetical protein
MHNKLILVRNAGARGVIELSALAQHPPPPPSMVMQNGLLDCNPGLWNMRRDDRWIRNMVSGS